MFANHGQSSRYAHKFEGINSRMDGIQAAVLNIKLPHLARWSSERYKNAQLYVKYLKHLEKIILPEIPQEGSHVFHLFVVRLKNRNEIMAKLEAQGVPTVIHYPTALPNLEAYKYLGCQANDFPIATAFQDEILSLPMYPELSESEIKYIAEILSECA